MSNTKAEIRLKGQANKTPGYLNTHKWQSGDFLEMYLQSGSSLQLNFSHLKTLHQLLSYYQAVK